MSEHKSPQNFSLSFFDYPAMENELWIEDLSNLVNSKLIESMQFH